MVEQDHPPIEEAAGGKLEVITPPVTKPVLRVLKEKFIKDTKTMVSDVICGCPQCRYEARSISGWWSIPMPTIPEAKHFKKVFEDRNLLK